MDILKKLIANPGLQHVADIVIGHLDKDFWTNLAEDREYRELFTEGEQEFLMKTKAVKTLRKSLYDEAKKVCEEKREFADFEEYKREAYWEYYDPMRFYNMSIFDMFPFFAEALEELKNSDSLPTFQQLQKTLSLLEFVSSTGNRFRFSRRVSRVRQACLHECVLDETDDQDVKKGAEDMIKILNQLWIDFTTRD